MAGELTGAPCFSHHATMIMKLQLTLAHAIIWLVSLSMPVVSLIMPLCL